MKENANDDFNYNFKFDNIKDTYKEYLLVKDEEENVIALNKKTKEKVSDQFIIDRLKFSLAWVVSFLSTINRKTDECLCSKEDYEIAFNDNAKKIYFVMMDKIQNQIVKTGNIDTIEIIENIKKLNIDNGDLYVKKFLSSRVVLEVLDKWIRYSINEALPRTKPLLTYKDAKLKKNLNN